MSSVAAMPLDADELVWRMPVERYHAMIRTGVLTDDDRLELLEGVLVEKMSKNPGHRIATRRTCDALRSVLPVGWYADEQAPITTADSEPEPDICIVRGSTNDYADRHPGPADVALVVDVADSSVRRDRGTKKRIYARAGIAAYWLIDLAARTLEVYTESQGADFGRRAVLTEGDEVSLVLEGEVIASLPVGEFFAERGSRG